MYCVKWGTENPEDVLFCGKYSEKFGVEEKREKIGKKGEKFIIWIWMYGGEESYLERVSQSVNSTISIIRKAKDYVLKFQVAF